MKNVKFKAKAYRIGESWGMTIPKQYVKDETIDPLQELVVTLEQEGDSEEICNSVS